MVTLNVTLSFLCMMVKFERLLYVMDMLNWQGSTKWAVLHLPVVSLYELYVPMLLLYCEYIQCYHTLVSHMCF